MILNFTFSDGIYLPVPTVKMKGKLQENGGTYTVDSFPAYAYTESQIIKPEGEDRRLFIEAIAVHEFGHALGFSHEQARENQCSTTSNCNFPEPMYKTPAIISVTCNERSVMNYCNDVYLNEGFLSPFDRSLLKKYYQKKVEIKEPILLEYSLMGFSIRLPTVQIIQRNAFVISSRIKRVLLIQRDSLLKKVKFIFI